MKIKFYILYSNNTKLKKIIVKTKNHHIINLEILIINHNLSIEIKEYKVYLKLKSSIKILFMLVNFVIFCTTKNM